jgi:adenine-specific DNA-methyltransferase
MASLENLIEHFESDISYFKSGSFNETQTRREFIDPFLELLGWNTEDHKQVIHEDKLKVKGKSKAPDYGMVINGSKRLFYVEAKKPSVDIFEGKAPAFQIKRYAYTAKLPVSIVTDFEEFAIYDTSKKPNETDKADVSRIFFCKYNEYLKPLSTENHKRFKKEYDLEFESNFELINHFFNKENVYNGSLDTFKKKVKKGHKTIDDEILKDVENWRKLLAENIARHNKNLDVYQLNEAVQKILDRIIFLRMAEDRNTKEYKRLKSIIDGKDVYENLTKYFISSDKKYNSRLFKQEDWISQLNVSNSVFKDIVKDLYYPKPYEFSILPIETLGHIYEQFLGKTISLNEKHQVIIELKPEVRKAGGVYYTPEYIVEYIVKNTVGKKVKGKSPKQVETLTVLDPACGSGSFLIGAYNFLLEYHLEYYKKNIKKSIRQNLIFDAGEGEYRLTFREKRKILLNNIYGVDIDSQAVEVTKLSLLLKMMEGEIMESNDQLFAQSEGILPNLENNIKCGNSLIGSDFYSQDNMSLFDDEHKRRKINTFDWDSEDGFKSIMDAGGFDCVIGNPPYFRIEASRDDSDYLRTYKTTEFKIDAFTLFIEKMMNNGFGRIGFIIPNNLMTNQTDRKLRKKILDESNIEKIVNYKVKVFDQAVVHTMVLIINSITTKSNNIGITQVYEDKVKEYEISQNSFLEEQDYLFNIRLLGEEKTIIEHINKYSEILDKVCEIKQAIKTGDDKKYISEAPLRTNYKKIIGGKEMQRYQLHYKNRYVDYGKHLACARNIRIFENEKIILRETGKRISATFDSENYYLMSSVYSLLKRENITLDLKFILGFLNSNVSQYFMKLLCFDNSSGAFTKARIFHYKQLPIRTIDFDNPKEKAQHDKLVGLVEMMLETQKHLHSENIKTDSDKKFAQQKVDILDKQIDDLVYELYELTDEEIKIVEESIK